MRFKRNPLFWVAAIISLVLDHLTKFWVVQNFDLTVPPQTQPLLPGIFHFTYVVNTGVAFSLFSNGGASWLRWLSLGVSVGLMVAETRVMLSGRRRVRVRTHRYQTPVLNLRRVLDWRRCFA